jgi:hypothetical protein
MDSNDFRTVDLERYIDYGDYWITGSTADHRSKGF